MEHGKCQISSIMKILAIETSCDETSAAVVERKGTEQFVTVLSNSVATSLDIHATTGGIIPETAAREQVKYILPIIQDAIKKAFKPDATDNEIRELIKTDIDAIAVTSGPGLMGSLLVGVETAKALSYIFNKPIIPVNHLLAHLYANFINTELNPNRYLPSFPFIGLIVSGGHTDLLYFENHEKYKWLGGTRDDAAGEAFDKIGRLLNLPYPAGSEIERRAKQVLKPTIKFQSPLLRSDDFDFSFSGLKSEVMRFVMKSQPSQPSHSESVKSKTTAKLSEELINQICYATQDAIIKVLVAKTLKAAEKYNCETILLGGGVSANQALFEKFELNAKRLPRFDRGYPLNVKIFVPERKFSTDNAAMIGAYALMNPKPKQWQKIGANPELYFG